MLAGSWVYTEASSTGPFNGFKRLADTQQGQEVVVQGLQANERIGIWSLLLDVNALWLPEDINLTWKLPHEPEFLLKLCVTGFTRLTSIPDDQHNGSPQLASASDSSQLGSSTWELEAESVGEEFSLLMSPDSVWISMMGVSTFGDSQAKDLRPVLLLNLTVMGVAV